VKDPEVPAPASAGTNQPAPPPAGIVFNRITFETVKYEDLPEAVKAWVDQIAQAEKHVAARMDNGDYTYVVVGLGQKPTAGYGVEVVSVSDPEAGKYTFEVKEAQPEAGSMQAQVITYPCTVVRLQKTNIPFLFKSVDGSSFVDGALEAK
jgi:hypothetical protein